MIRRPFLLHSIQVAFSESGIICRPIFLLRVPFSYILPFRFRLVSHSSLICSRENPTFSVGAEETCFAPLSGCLARLMQPRDSVASRNCARRHCSYYITTSNRSQHLPGSFCPQEIHNVISIDVNNTNMPDMQKARSGRPSFLVPIFTARLSALA